MFLLYTITAQEPSIYPQSTNFDISRRLKLFNILPQPFNLLIIGFPPYGLAIQSKLSAFRFRPYGPASIKCRYKFKFSDFSYTLVLVLLSARCYSNECLLLVKTLLPAFLQVPIFYEQYSVHFI